MVVVRKDGIKHSRDGGSIAVGTASLMPLCALPTPVILTCDAQDTF